MCGEADSCRVFDLGILLHEWQAMLRFFSLGSGEMDQRAKSLLCEQDYWNWYLDHVTKKPHVTVGMDLECQSWKAETILGI